MALFYVAKFFMTLHCITMLVTLIKYCNDPCHASTKIVTAPVMLYFLACGNDNNGKGRCNGVFSVTI